MLLVKSRYIDIRYEGFDLGEFSLVENGLSQDGHSVVIVVRRYATSQSEGVVGLDRREFEPETMEAHGLPGIELGGTPGSKRMDGPILGSA